ncbi:hypothetical protein ACVW00_001435 [Marmoricola sp. URHA0025 HA25]
MSHGVLDPVRRHRSRLVAGLTLVLAAGALFVVPPLASASPAPTATAIIVDTAFSASITVPDTPGVGASYVVQDDAFTVSFHTDLPLSTTHDTTVTLTAAGTSVTATGIVPKDVTTGTISGVVLPDPANGVVLTVTAPDPAVAAGTITVDVLATSLTAPSSTKLTGIGGGGGAGLKCVPTTNDPTCGDLLLPESAAVQSGELLSRGSCANVCGTITGADLRSVLQLLVKVDPLVYNKSNPIEFVAKCDKTLCPGKGVKTYSVKVQLKPGDPVVVSPACLSKGVIASTQEFCTDYVQSSRNGAGDVLLYVELPIDAKIIW